MMLSKETRRSFRQWGFCLPLSIAAVALIWAFLFPEDAIDATAYFGIAVGVLAGTAYRNGYVGKRQLMLFLFLFPSVVFAIGYSLMRSTHTGSRLDPQVLEELRRIRPPMWELLWGFLAAHSKAVVAIVLVLVVTTALVVVRARLERANRGGWFRRLTETIGPE